MLGYFVALSALVSSAATGHRPSDLDEFERGLALVEQSLAAHGGLDAVLGAPGIEITLSGRYDLSARVQGRHFGRAEWTPIEERISIDTASGRVGYDSDFYNYFGSNQRLREVHDEGPLFVDFQSGEGGYVPFTFTDDAQERYRRYLPQFLLADILDNRATLRAGGEAEFRGCAAETVYYATATGDRLRIYFDRLTHLVCGASTILPMPVLGDTAMDYRWGGYRLQREAYLPSSFNSWLGERSLKETTMAVRFAIDPGSLGPPAGVSVGEPPESLRRLADFQPAGARIPQVETVADGVHMINGLRPGFRTPFIEFEDFVLVVDAPTGYYDIQQIPPFWGSPGDSVDALGEKIVRAVAETVPGKPIRYLALTHHHSDHIGGLRPLVVAGATLIGTAPVLEAADHALAAARHISGELPAGETRIPPREIVSESHVISDGSMEARIIELPSDNPKAAGFTVIYLPRQRLLYSTGFIYPVAEGTPPPPESVDLALWFVDWLENAQLDIDLHYNIHGSGPIEQHHIDALRAAAVERLAN